MQSTLRHIFRNGPRLLMQKMEQHTAVDVAPAPSRIIAVEPDIQQRTVNVLWEDGVKGKFPFVWLLDCSPMVSEEMAVCKNTLAHNRVLTLNELNVQVKPEKLALDPRGERIFVQWPPFYEVAYESDWLKEHVFVTSSADTVSAERQWQTWGRADLQDRLPTVDAHDLRHGNIMATREKLLEFAKYGVLVVKDGANNVGALEALGYNKVDLEQNVVKCLTHGVQGLHTGAPHKESVPSLGMLVVRNSPNDADATMQLVDGFRVAEQLQETHPAVFTFLCNTPIEYNGVSNSQKQKSPNARPIFSLSPTGVVQRVTFNNALRSSRFSVPPENLEDFYKALKTFNSYCYQSRNLLNVHVNHGDVVLVANNRILHGNTAYSMGDESWVDEIFLDEEPLKRTLKRLQGS